MGSCFNIVCSVVAAALVLSVLFSAAAFAIEGAERLRAIRARLHPRTQLRRRADHPDAAAAEEEAMTGLTPPPTHTEAAASAEEAMTGLPPPHTPPTV